MRRNWQTTLLLVVFTGVQTAACAPRTGATGPLGAAIPTPSMLGRDRVVIREHTDIVAVAATRRSVFAVSTRGLIVYDRVFQRWKTPDARVVEDLTAAGVIDARIRTIAADPLEDAVWIAVPGAVVVYRVAAQQVQRLAVAGQPDVIRFARGDASDAYVRTGNQWLRVSRAGFVSPVSTGVGSLAFIQDAQLPDVYQRYPALRGQLPLLLRDDTDGHPSGMFSRVSSATFSSEQPSELFVGTTGDGLWSFNADFYNGAALRYGLLDDAVGALAAGVDGVWAAGQGQSVRSGLSFVSRDAQQFVWRTASMGATLRGLRVRDLVVRGSEAWLGTDRGVRVMNMNDNANVREINTFYGLPHNDVTSVLVLSGSAWIGTRGGLAVVTDGAAFSSDGRTAVNAIERTGGEVFEIVALRGVPIHALARTESGLFVGTARGVFALGHSRPGPTAEVASLWSGTRALQMPIRALATSDSVLLVVTDAEALLMPLPVRITGPAARVPPAEPAANRSSSGPGLLVSTDQSPAGIDIRIVGRVVAAAIDEQSVWVAGERGVLSWGRDGAAPKLLRSGREVPDVVSDLLLDGPVAWIGTRQGLVRVPRARDGGLP